MAEKVQEEDPRRAKRRKDVERRAKFLATLTPAQRTLRDNHIAWVRWWRKEYKTLVSDISQKKAFLRRSGHNNLLTLKHNMKYLHTLQRKARTMLLARMASKVDYQMKVDKKPKVAA